MQLVTWLEQGRLDLAFVRLPVTLGPGFALEVLAKEPMVVALPSAHRLAARRTVRLTDLRTEEFILYPRAMRLGLSDAIVTACTEAGFTPKVVQLAPQISSTINLVASSMGVSIVPACMRNSRADAVRYVPLTGTQLSATLCVAYRTAAQTPPLANLVAAALDAKRDRPRGEASVIARRPFDRIQWRQRNAHA